FDNLKQKVAGANKTIVFPEGQEPRIFRAAIRLKNDGLVVPILLGKVDEIKQNVENEGVDLGDIELIDPNTYPEDKFAEMVEAFVERRKGKNTKEQAETMLRDVNYFGTMLVYM
ncbi:phosphate acetyltransferase, partial [Lactobacillus salivarius]|nr:phosphate acetyltransferase [Ligilactobacillus salivarius]